MLYLARISKEFKDDPDKTGWLPVVYKEQVRWARPLLPFSSFWLPTKEWVEKYADTVGVWVTTESDREDRENYLVYVGFVFMEEQAPTVQDYGYDRYVFTENWEILVKDTPDNNLIRLNHRENGISVVFDKDGFSINDINGNYLLGRKDIGADSQNGININGEVLIALKPFVDWVSKLLDELISLKILGNLGSPAPVFPPNLVKLQQLKTELQAGIQPKGTFLSDRVKVS